MDGFYKDVDKLYVAVDCIIFGFDEGELKLLMTLGNKHCEGIWSLIGGFFDKNENIDNAAKRILKELTSLDDIFMAQLGAFGEVNRVPYDRVITVAYYALIKITPELNQKICNTRSEWFTIKDLPDFTFDHELIFKSALDKLREELKFKPIGAELLPKEFTMPQLKKLYEAILGTSLDTRNFSRKMLSQNIIVNTGKKDKQGSKKGAWLYSFTV